MSRMLGDEFGLPGDNLDPIAAKGELSEADQKNDVNDFRASDDGGSSEIAGAGEWGLRIEMGELRAELEYAHHENERLLVEKDAAGELILNLYKQIEELENETRGTDQRVRRAGPASQPDTNEPIFQSLEEWVGKWLLPLYRRELDNRSTTFCVQWWRHPETYYRLDALWKSWEFMRLKPGTGTAVWMKDYCDPHMAVLMSSNGPMSGCTLKKHSDHATEPWPLEPIPGTRQLVRLYELAGLQYTDPKPAFEGRRALGAVEAVPWDGKDQR
jgi:Domain of unknown function (DUF4913)